MEVRRSPVPLVRIPRSMVGGRTSCREDPRNLGRWSDVLSGDPPEPGWMVGRPVRRPPGTWVGGRTSSREAPGNLGGCRQCEHQELSLAPDTTRCVGLYTSCARPVGPRQGQEAATFVPWEVTKSSHTVYREPHVLSPVRQRISSRDYPEVGDPVKTRNPLTEYHGTRRRQGTTDRHSSFRRRVLHTHPQQRDLSVSDQWLHTSWTKCGGERGREGDR